MHPDPRRASPETLQPASLASSPRPRQHGLVLDHDSPRSPPLEPGDYGAYEGSTSEWSLSPSSSGSPAEGYDGWLNPDRWEAYQSRLRDVADTSEHFEPADEVSLLQAFPEEMLFQVISHLPAADLLNVKLVSRRFYHLVSSPHAWMHAFSRFFVGPESLKATADSASPAEHGMMRSEQRAFTRLTSTTSWSGEYLRRTKLLRCIVRGKPALPFACPAPGRPDKGMAVFTFSSRLGLESSHLDADWGHALDKRKPFFIHGFAGTGNVTSSDRKGKFDAWGVTDRNMFRSFASEHPGSAMYGAGQGYIIGTPNTMDVSQSHGMVHSECTPGGNVYFIGHDEKRGRSLASFLNFADELAGIPKINPAHQCATTVWIAKSPSLPRLSSGLVGILAGSSMGVLSAYSLGPSAKRDQRYERGELTARWVLSPGVPIVAVTADEHLSERRLADKRVLAVAMNAFGEVFYLTNIPHQTPLPRGHEDDLAERRERRAWLTGQTCKWELISSTKRDERNPEMYATAGPSYLPHIFHQDAILGATCSGAQDAANFQRWFTMTPSDMQRAFNGWNMHRTVQVDFGGDDGKGAGEHILVVDPNRAEDDEGGTKSAKLVRFSRCIVTNGGNLKAAEPDASQQAVPYQWSRSLLDLGRFKSAQLTASAIDNSLYAATTLSEDEAHCAAPTSSGSPNSPSKFAGQRARFVAIGTATGSVLLWNIRGPLASSADVVNELTPLRIIHTPSPGISSIAVSALLVVHGGADGLIQAWDPLASTTEPLRTLTSQKSINNRRRLILAARANPEMHVGLYPTTSFAASNIVLDPDPTILRGIASVGGWLRYWSYSSASPDADLTKAQKRKLKRGHRGLAAAPSENFTGTRRVGLKGFVDSELALRDLEKRDMIANAREERRVANRFGLDLLGEDASEEDMVAYAKMLSEEEDQKRIARSLQETLPANASPETIEAHFHALSSEDQAKWKYASWEERREMVTSESRALSQISSPILAARRREKEQVDDDLRKAMELSMLESAESRAESAATPKASSPRDVAVEESDPDLAEAIRQSLMVSPSSSPPSGPAYLEGEDDLARAIRLSRANMSPTSSPGKSPSAWGSPLLRGQRRESAALSDDEFPTLGSSPGVSGALGRKGKDKSAW